MDLFTLFGRIAIDSKDAHSAMDGIVNKAGGAFNKVGGFALSCGKVIGKGLIAGGAAVGTLIAGSTKAYAEYEQLAGGVETLFKDSNKQVLAYADSAYATAGMSANEYMSTVTSFSASLLQSLGGDTGKAADVANMAITDMADNANKMGTSMESIQNAYQGFAKQNYTMLDNLKLGYGGTKSEMQRLLKDAQKITGKKYNLKNLNDVYEAIHVIQTEYGITGTTALEASETISGSFATMKAAWENLLVGMAGGTEDLDGVISNFAGSVSNLFGNIVKILPNIAQGINQMISGLMPQIPGMLQSLLPVVLDGAVSLITGLASQLPAMAEMLIAELPGILDKIGGAIGEIWTTGIWPALQEIVKLIPGCELPDWATIEAYFNAEWPKLQKSIEDFCTWTLKLFENPNEAMHDVEKSFGVWWTSTGEPALKNASKWVLQLFGVPIEDDATIAEHIGTWWDLACDAVQGACAWVLKLFGVPLETADQIMETVRGWWDGIVGVVVDACKWQLGIPGMPSEEGTKNEILAWWQRVIQILGLLTFGVAPTFGGNKKSYIAGVAGNAFGSIFSGGTGAVHVGGVGKGFASGLDFVPKDNFMAKLHFGEAVLTRAEANEWRSGQSGAHVAELTASVHELVNDLPDMLVNAFATMQFNVNNREFARLVKAVN